MGNRTDLGSDSEEEEEALDGDSSDDEEPEFTDCNNVNYHEYRYTAQTSTASFLNEEEEEIL